MSGHLVTFVVIASASCGLAETIRRWDDDYGNGEKWIRLCTLISHGGSVINVTVPCDVRVHGEFTIKKESADGDGDTAEDFHDKGGSAPKDRPDGGGIVSEDHHDGGGSVVSSFGNKVANRRHDRGQNTTVEDDGSGSEGDTLNGRLYSNVSGLEVTVSESGSDRTETIDSEDDEYDDNDDDDGITVVEEQDDGVTEIGVQDDGGNIVRTSGEGHNATVDEIVKMAVLQDDTLQWGVSGQGVTVNAAAKGDRVEVDGDDDDDSVIVVHNEQDGHEGLRQHGAVTKALLAYLLEARNRLHNKIHNLLNFLQHAFFNAKNHRSRRNLVKLQTLVNGRRQGNKNKQSIASVILEPTFERSLMTMSFLMFGVFVIQVVQRLMQTLQQSGEITSMGNSIFENLRTVQTYLNNKQ